MAYTATLQKINVMGNQRVSQYLVTADAASGSVVTNMGTLDCAVIGPISMATAGIKVKINTSAASAAANGQVLISSAVSGDAFFLICYGKA
jgi:hypothetical protein